MHRKNRRLPLFSRNFESRQPPFNGNDFYKRFVYSDFLYDPENVRNILSNDYWLKKKMAGVPPGKSATISDLLVHTGQWSCDRPLQTGMVIKSTAPNIKIRVNNDEFTRNRLKGLVAAFVYENRKHFPKLNCPEANELGLFWNNSDKTKCRLFLSAIPGAEYFDNQFSFLPFLCVLKKFHLDKLNIDAVVRIATMKIMYRKHEKTMLEVLHENTRFAHVLWGVFPSSWDMDLKSLIASLPPKLKCFFVSAVRQHHLRYGIRDSRMDTHVNNDSHDDTGDDDDTDDVGEGQISQTGCLLKNRKNILVPNSAASRLKRLRATLAQVTDVNPSGSKDNTKNPIPSLLDLKFAMPDRDTSD